MLVYDFAVGAVEWVDMVFSAEGRWECPGFRRLLKLLVGYFQKGIVVTAGDSCWRCYRRQPGDI
jgi:hypothetical protein